jgi:histidine triad (HIT) family protein
MNATDGGCIFCKIATGGEESWRIHETPRALAFLAVPGVSDYHTLVIPKAHHEDIFDVPEDVLLDVTSTLKHVVDVYRSRLDIRDLQVINSSGIHAQQSVFHLHFHILPRRAGDGLDTRWPTRTRTREDRDVLLESL